LKGSIPFDAERRKARALAILNIVMLSGKAAVQNSNASGRFSLSILFIGIS